MTPFSDPQSRPYARLTGALYLSIAVAGAFAIGFVPSQLFVEGDAAASVANVLSRRGLFNLGIGADGLVMLIELFVTAMLFFMFKPVNATLALVASLARLSMVSVMAAMLLFQAGVVALAEPGAALQSFSAAQRADLAGLMLHIHDAGVWVWQLFFALHLALLGQLVARSGQYPRLLGHALTLGSVGYLLDSIYSFAAPDFALLGTVRIGFLVIVTLSEVGFALWLLIRGPRSAA